MSASTLTLKPFSKNEVYGQLDHIVIGSGVGGLTTASFLAKAGRRVLVLEQHTVPGGLSHTFQRKGGFVWDVGLHYVGQMMPTGSILRDFFDYITDHQLKWDELGDSYDKTIIGKNEYLFPKGKENLISYLKNRFPSEHVAIDRYFAVVQKTVGYSGLFFAEKAFPSLLSKTLGPLFRKPFLKFASLTTAEVVYPLTENPELRAVLCSQFGNYGLAPNQSSFGAHAIIVSHFMDGGFYPQGGSSQIATSIIASLAAKKAMVRTHAKVSEIIVQKNKVCGVKVGEIFIPCKSVISNIGVRQTFLTQLKPSACPKFVEEISAIKPSTAHFGLYLGLDTSAKALQLPKHNTWFYANSNLDDIANEGIESPHAPLHFAYISFPSAKDSAWDSTMPNKATVQAIGIANEAWFKDFESLARSQRGDAYTQLKNDFQQKMTAKIESLWPQIKNHIVHTEVSTPLSTKHFMNNAHGEMYGLEHSPKRFQTKALRPETSIKGLYLTGQDILTVGIASALFSGFLTSVQILKYKIAFRFIEMYRQREIIQNSAE